MHRLVRRLACGGGEGSGRAQGAERVRRPRRPCATECALVRLVGFWGCGPLVLVKNPSAAAGGARRQY